jgi:exopolysaccharide production protein ExoY
MVQADTHRLLIRRGSARQRASAPQGSGARDLVVASSGPGMDPQLRRAIDVAIAGVAVFFLLPLLGLISVAIWLQDGGPVIYSQLRVGRNGDLFHCLKFRSMRQNAQAELERLLANNPHARAEWHRSRKLRNDPRITPVGRLLRKSSLDELPQLFNVLNGSMNLVGPRPIVPEEAALYGHRIASYQSVLPGITGLWQIGGRNDVSYRRRVALDHLYVRHRTLMFDLKILMMTIPAVVLRKGSY